MIAQFAFYTVSKKMSFNFRWRRLNEINNKIIFYVITLGFTETDNFEQTIKILKPYKTELED